MAGGNLANLNVKLTADSSQYNATFKAASAALGEFAKQQAEAFGDIAKDLAAAFTLDKLVEFGKGAIESAASLNLLSQTSGVSAEALSSLRLAAAASGLGQDQLGESLKHLNLSLSETAGDPTSKAGEAFRALGLSALNADGSLKSAAQALPDIADKFQNLADGPNKTAIAVDLLGRAGEQMIPVLNGGSAALKEFQKQAEDAGLVISGSLAAAADDFSTHMTVLKATVVDGLGVQIASKLLPVLQTLTESFESGGQAGTKLASVADVIVGGVKIVTAIVLEAANEFTELGNSMGAIGAIAVDIAHGNFKEAATIWKESNADNLANAKKTTDAINDVFAAGSDQELLQLSTTQAAKHKILDTGTSPTVLKAQDDAIKQLSEFDAGLHAQAAAFGLGSAAAVAYKLQFGPLADAIKKAGDAGAALKSKIMIDANQLQFKQAQKQSDDLKQSLVEQIATYDDGDLAAFRYKITTGELGQAFKNMGDQGKALQESLVSMKGVQISQKDSTAVQGLNVELEQMAGHLRQAADDGFALQNALLIKNVAATGSDADKAALASKKAVIDAQADYDELVQKATIIQSAYAAAEAAVSAQIANGQTTTLDGQSAIDAARQKEIADLQQVYTAEKAIADQNEKTMPQLAASTQAFQTQLAALGSQTNTLSKQINDDFKSAFVDNLVDAQTGAKSLGDAFHSMALSIEKDLLQIADKNIAESILGSGNSGGGIAGLLAGFLGGSSSGASIASTGAAAAGTSTDAAADALGATFASSATFAGGFAKGGTIPAGQWGVVGENGPEPVYSGAKDLHVIPNGGGGGGGGLTVNNTFMTTTPNGTISRPSQMQAANQAATQIAIAARRNGRR